MDLVTLGQAELLAGDVARAADALHSGLETAVEVGNRPLATEALRALAAVAAATGEVVHTARLHGTAERLAEEMGYTVPPVDRRIEERFVTPIRETDRAAFDEARAEGRELTFEAAVAYGLEYVGRVGATL